MLIVGNDERRIEVGIKARTELPSVSIRSHVDDTDEKGTIFSRDCAEYEIALPSGGTLWVLVNHFKRKSAGQQSDSNAKRLRQAKRVGEIHDENIAHGLEEIAVRGDFNETPDSTLLAAFLANGCAAGRIREIRLDSASTYAAFGTGGGPAGANR